MQKEVSYLFPPTLLSAVFRAEGYVIAEDEWEQYAMLLQECFLMLSPIQQQVLTVYYSGNISQRRLAEQYGISPKRCRQQLHKGLHQLRKAANPLYRAAIEKIHTIKFQ